MHAAALELADGRCGPFLPAMALAEVVAPRTQRSWIVLAVQQHVDPLLAPAGPAVAAAQAPNGLLHSEQPTLQALLLALLDGG